MYNNSTAILALILLIVLVIIVVVALAYNPAPAVVVKPTTKTAKEILADRTQKVTDCKSNMSPPNRTQLSPASEGSAVSNAWEALENIRQQRSQRNVY